MKYDGAQTDRGNPTTRRLRRLAGFDDSDIVFLAGSTQEPEEALALAVYRALSPRWPQLRLVLVPRHPDRFAAVARLLAESGLPWQRRSELQNPSPFKGAERSNPSPFQGEGRERVNASPSERQQSATHHPSPLTQPLPSRGEESFNALPFHLEASQTDQPRILLVDAVGELAAWWGTAHIAFVGGSLGNRGGQNMIEPAAYGAAVSFGPNTWNFRDIVAAMSRGRGRRGRSRRRRADRVRPPLPGGPRVSPRNWAAARRRSSPANWAPRAGRSIC